MPVGGRIDDNLARIDRLVISWTRLCREPLVLERTADFTLVLMHIPKTAGTTLRHVLSKNFDPREENDIRPRVLLKNPNVLFKNKRLSQVIMGHFNMSGFVYHLIDRPLIHITVLRDPVRRFISAYDYYEADRDTTLEEYVTAAESRGRHNEQSLRLTGWYGRKVGQDEIDDQELLNDARQILANRFSFFGLTERFSEFLLMAQKLLNWRDVFFEQQNISKKKTATEGIDPVMMQRIRELNAVDIELYEYACSLFDTRCEQLSIDQKAIDRHRRLNQQFQDLLEQQATT